MIDKLYYSLQKNFSWWTYYPLDEREKSIYLKAYKRSFFAFVFGIGFVLIPVDLFSDAYQVFAEAHAIAIIKTISIIILAVFIIAILIGGTAFNKESIKFKKR